MRDQQLLSLIYTVWSD